MHKKQAFSLWHLPLPLVLLVVLQDVIEGRQTQTLSYSEFKQALAAD